MINLKVEPVFYGLHSDPRFLDFIHRVGIPQNLVEEIRFVTEDAREKWLKLEPSREMSSYLPPGSDRLRVIDPYRLTSSLGEQLRVATPVHGDEPPGCLFHRLAHGEQAVIPQNCRLVRTEGFRNPLTLGSLVHYTCEVRE
jgi:hypothetical protein